MARISKRSTSQRGNQHSGNADTAGKRAPASASPGSFVEQPSAETRTTSSPEKSLKIVALLQEVADLMSESKSIALNVRSEFHSVQRLILSALASTSPEVPPLPKRAPERWADRSQKSEGVGEFVRRVYGQWILPHEQIADITILSRLLTSRALRTLDVTLYKHYLEWRTTPEGSGDDLFIPTKAQLNSIKLRIQGIPIDDITSNKERADSIANAIKYRTRNMRRLQT